MTVIKYDKEKINSSQTNISHLEEDYLKQLKAFKDLINRFSTYWVGSDATSFFERFKKDILEYEQVVNDINKCENYLNICSDNLTQIAKLTSQEK